MTTMHLQIHLPGADPYPIGDELGDLSLGDAITRNRRSSLIALEDRDGGPVPDFAAWARSRFSPRF